MTGTASFRRAGLSVLACTLATAALAAADKNLAANGGFEEVANGVPAGWFTGCNDGGSVTWKCVTDQPKQGKYCLELKAKGEWAFAASPKVAVSRTKAYLLTGYVRVKSGTATIKIDYYKGDEFLGHSDAEHVTGAEWKQLKVSSELHNFPAATHVLVAAVTLGDTEAYFDQFELTTK
jgi:hypothetical protein